MLDRKILWHFSYQAVVTNHPSVQATAIHDDVTLVGPPDDLVQAYRTIVEQAKTINLQAQPHKCQFIYFHNCNKPSLFQCLCLVLL